MKHLFPLFISLLLVQCKTTSTTMTPKENFTATGIAQNAKYSACITTDDKKLYYIPQVSSWSSAEENKKIQVTGTLYERGNAPKPVNPKEPQSQEINSKFYTIENATWKVVE